MHSMRNCLWHINHLLRLAYLAFRWKCMLYPHMPKSMQPLTQREFALVTQLLVYRWPTYYKCLS